MWFRILILFIISFHSRYLFAQDRFITVYFDFNAAELTITERLHLLYFLSDSLDKDRSYTVQIKGYCDFIDDDSYNNILSLQRAESVKSILLSNGIQQSAITLCEGFGERSANPSQSSEDERKLQRRVEVAFLCTCHDAFTEMQSIQTDDTQQNITDTSTDDDYFVDGEIEIDKYDVGDKFALGHLNFIGGRHKLLPESLPVLKDLLQVMQENPDLQIMIIGHICCEQNGSDGYDYDTHTYDLSVNRAKEIYEYLKRNGVDAERMQYRGAASTQKIYWTETSEMQKTANRRVEIEIVAM